MLYDAMIQMQFLDLNLFIINLFINYLHYIGNVLLYVITERINFDLFLSTSVLISQFLIIVEILYLDIFHWNLIFHWFINDSFSTCRFLEISAVSVQISLMRSAWLYGILFICDLRWAEVYCTKFLRSIGLQ